MAAPLLWAWWAGCGSSPGETPVDADTDTDTDSDTDADTDADSDSDADTDTDTDATGDTAAPCATVTTFDARLGDQILEARFVVDLDAPADVYVACTSPDDPLERHLLETHNPAAHHELALQGLLPAITYSCVAAPVCGGAPLAGAPVLTGMPVELPRLTATHTPGETSSGAYTLFNEEGGCGNDAVTWAAIVDPDARLRWAYEVGDDLVLDVDLKMVDRNTLHMGGGWGTFDDGQSNLGVFRDVDLSGHTVLERTAPDFGLGFNHHSEPYPDGTYLSLTGHTDTDGRRSWNGVGVELWEPGLGVVWTWDTGPMALSGELPPPTIFDVLFPSPYLVNSASLVDDTLGPALWLSCYPYEELWRVDRTTGLRSHVFGAGGDFTLVDPAGNPLPDSEYTWVQHGIDYTSDGHVLAYDNGLGRPGGSYSRVVEYQLDLATYTATRLWSWTEPGWLNTVVGDADYLPNGNVLVTQGFSRCAEIVANDVSEIVELRPPDTVVSRITWPTSSWGVYRSERYDGCDLFDNARYCPALADRWTALGL